MNPFSLTAHMVLDLLTVHLSLYILKLISSLESETSPNVLIEFLMRVLKRRIVCDRTLELINKALIVGGYLALGQVEDHY